METVFSFATGDLQPSSASGTGSTGLVSRGSVSIDGDENPMIFLSWQQNEGYMLRWINIGVLQLFTQIRRTESQ